MINKNDTTHLLEEFFSDSFRFWVNGGKDDRKAFELALNEVRELKCNPFSPQGDELDPEAKAQFIRYREMDLGI